MRIAQSSPRKGAILLVVALCLFALVGVVALVVDGGQMFDERRRCQAAADAAALAAAEQIGRAHV